MSGIVKIARDLQPMHAFNGLIGFGFTVSGPMAILIADGDPG